MPSQRVTRKQRATSVGAPMVRTMRTTDVKTIVHLDHLSFPTYDHAFSSQSLTKWFKHNPDMFFVVTDHSDDVLGYAAIIPIDSQLLWRLRQGLVSSVVEFSESHVPVHSSYFHIEVVAVRPDLRGTRISACLLLAIADRLLSEAEIVTASPINATGQKLCESFGFKPISEERLGKHTYSVYELTVDKKRLSDQVAALRDLRPVRARSF